MFSQIAFVSDFACPGNDILETDLSGVFLACVRNTGYGFLAVAVVHTIPAKFDNDSNKFGAILQNI